MWANMVATLFERVCLATIVLISGTSVLHPNENGLKKNNDREILTLAYSYIRKFFWDEVKTIFNMFPIDIWHHGHRWNSICWWD